MSSADRSTEVRPAPVHRPEIDGLRALAVLWVVFFHASPDRLPGGYIGVDVFFVISGYLITGILLRDHARGSFSLADFYYRRCRRILPALTVVLLSTWAAGYLLLDSNDLASLGKHMAASSLFVSNILLWSEAGYFDLDSNLKPLLHFWSLGVEEQFYLFWPLILVGLFKLRSARAVPIGLVLLFVVSFAINIGGIKDHPSATFYLLPSRFWELLSGGAIAWFEFAHPGRQIGAWFAGRAGDRRAAEAMAAELTGLIGLILIIVATITIGALTPFPGWYALMPVLGSAMLIHAGQGSWINRRLFSLRPAVLIGLISYPLYLWHWPLLSFMRIIRGNDDSRVLKYGLVLLGFVLAWLTWRLVEKPVQRWAGRVGHDAAGRYRALALSACVLAVLGGIGAFTAAQDGFPGRFPEHTALRKFHYNPAPDYRETECFLLYTQQASAFAPDCLPLPPEARRLAPASGHPDHAAADTSAGTGADAVAGNGAGAAAGSAAGGAVGSTEVAAGSGADKTSGTAAAIKPQIVLWGDSHAAHLALGLREAAPGLGAHFAQLTASACPPLQNFYRENRPFCPGIVAFALEQIRLSKPEVVVVSGAWYGVDAQILARELPRTVNLLKQAGVRHVIVVGPFPDWVPSLPRAMARFYREHQYLPERTWEGVRANLTDLDQAMRTTLKGQPVDYVSPRTVLCDDQGCLTGVVGDQFALVVSDTSHLTDVGSRLFATRGLIGPLRQALAD